ncbi:MAG: ribosome biogenesis GTP-binding protein YihA/YsxC [Candidatus Kapabacteria bacterium]|nr:ribosome biogenesis GTP-binding protein YihA/YsxC [Ignavibacteriota bacterium]MCW5883436.1 ribosome biogenesis GTP-binding protein YihA/YsxC [Candidatus Kapabacteria bacterium]
MQPMNAEFILGSAEISQFPEINLPEIAFSGRSNVGKSSLLNSIVLRKNLAYISSAPGKTQQINFFNVEGRWVFADLPGFGYATTGKENREKWKKLNFQYLESRKNLKLVAALIDSRHDPMNTDLALIEWYEENQKDFIIILTKCDKIKPGAISTRQKQIEHLVSQCKHCREVLPYSSQTSLGRNQLIGILKKITL